MFTYFTDFNRTSSCFMFLNLACVLDLCQLEYFIPRYWWYNCFHCLMNCKGLLCFFSSFSQFMLVLGIVVQTVFVVLICLYGTCIFQKGREGCHSNMDKLTKLISLILFYVSSVVHIFLSKINFPDIVLCFISCTHLSFFFFSFSWLHVRQVFFSFFLQC